MHPFSLDHERVFGSLAVGRSPLDRLSNGRVGFGRIPLGRLAIGLVLGLLFASPGWSDPYPVAAHPFQDRPGGVCDLYANKTALPKDVYVGDEVEVTLTLDGSCPPGTGGSGKSDILLAIDRSASQHDNGTWDPTVKAAGDFLDLIDFGRSQVAIMTFSDGVIPFIDPATVLRQPLSSDGAAVRAALQAIPPAPAFTGSTNITAAIQGAQRELTSSRHRADATPVLVLLSDGDHNTPSGATPASAAEAAKRAGTLIITIGLAPSATAEATLRQLASRPELYFPAPSGADLATAYKAAAGQLGQTGALTELHVVDLLPSEVEYVVGSAVPPPAAFQGNTLSWDIPRLSGGSWTARYRVKAKVVGTYSPNKLAYVDYLDADGAAASRTFPLPIISVRERQKFAVFLPYLQRHFCKPGRPFDVVLVLDTSTSMRGAKLDSTRAAAREFLQLLDMPPSSAALVTFNNEASVAAELSTDRPKLIAALDALQTAEGTRIDLALRAAAKVLASGTRDASHAPVVILITDGRQAGAADQDALNAAAEVRRTRALVYTIGIGDDLAADLLISVAGDPLRFYRAPSEEDLRRIYLDIAGALPCEAGAP